MEVSGKIGEPKLNSAVRLCRNNYQLIRLRLSRFNWPRSLFEHNVCVSTADYPTT